MHVFFFFVVVVVHCLSVEKFFNDQYGGYVNLMVSWRGFNSTIVQTYEILSCECDGPVA